MSAMKQLITIVAFTISLLPKIAEASTCRGLDVFTENMELSKTQQRIHTDLADVYKEKYRITKDFHDESLEMMVQFLQGSISRAEVLTLSEETHAERMNQDHEVQIIFGELLESLMPNQQHQLQQNLTVQQRCFANKKALQEQTRPKKGELLFANLNLTDDQRKIIIEVWHDRQASTTPMVYGLHHESLLEEYLKGTLSLSQQEVLFERSANTEGVFRHNQIDAMLDLLNSFDARQKSQFIENVKHIQAL
jgi:hypothetical protein